MRSVVMVGVIGFVLACAAAPAMAAPERAPFTDYRQAPTDQYGLVVSGVQSSGAQSSTQGTPSGSTSSAGTDITPVNANEPVSVPARTAGTTSALPTGGAGKSLPFTGFDLLLVVLLAGVAVSAGLFLRAATRVRRGSRQSAVAR